MPEELKIGFYITVILIGFLLYKKKKPRPTQLDLSGFKNSPKGKAIPDVRKVTAEVVDEAPDFDKGHVFVYEGKKYNAWRVFNLPLGASTAEIKKAYALKLQEESSLKHLYSKACNQLLGK